MNRGIKLSDFRKKTQPPEILNRIGNEKWYGIWVRRISVIISWTLAHFSAISPNLVTIIMIIWATIASVLLLVQGVWGILLFFLAHQLWITLDCVDGELARFKKQFSNSGMYLDGIGHAVVLAPLFLTVGLKFYEIQSNYIFIFLGSVASILILLNRLVYMTFKYHASEKKLSLKKETGISNFFIRIAVELLGHIEISMIASIFLFVFYYNSLTYIPHIFFLIYILLITVSIILSVINNTKSLNRMKF